MSPTNEASLLGLPRELRDMIYDLAIQSDFCHICSESVPLHLVCRQIHHESAALYQHRQHRGASFHKDFWKVHEAVGNRRRMYSTYYFTIPTPGDQIYKSLWLRFGVQTPRRVYQRRKLYEQMIQSKEYEAPYGYEMPVEDIKIVGITHLKTTRTWVSGNSCPDGPYRQNIVTYDWYWHKKSPFSECSAENEMSSDERKNDARAVAEALDKLELCARYAPKNMEIIALRMCETFKLVNQRLFKAAMLACDTKTPVDLDDDEYE